MTTNKEKITQLLLDQYKLEYNSDKEDEGYHGRTLNYFKVNKKKYINEKILDKIETKAGNYDAVILIDGENIHYNFNRKPNSRGEIPYLDKESMSDTFHQYIRAIGDGYHIDNVLFVIFSQNHAKNFYKQFCEEYSHFNILFFTDPPNQSEVDDILLVLAFKRLVLADININVYVRTNDNMAWLNIRKDLPDDSRDKQDIFIRQATQELLTETMREHTMDGSLGLRNKFRDNNIAEKIATFETFKIISTKIIFTRIISRKRTRF